MPLPVLDISKLLEGKQDFTQAGTRKLADALRDICHTQGFCYIIGHGMSEKHDALCDARTRFFNLPLAERTKISILNTPHFRGYTVLGQEVTGGKQDWRDQLDFCDEHPAKTLTPSDPDWLNLRGPNQWPEAIPELRPAVKSWMDGMYNVGMRLTNALGVGLGLDDNYFEPYFAPHFANRGDARLKLIRYRVPKTGGSSQGVGWHHDTGFLTFIKQDEIGGLQVKIDGTIINATPMKDALVMNLGEILQVATGGYLRATPHRVKSPPAGMERHSTAYFFNPNLEAQFEPIALPPEFAAKAAGTQNLNPNDPVFNIVGQNILKTRLRAHPDVAEKFYSAKH